MTIVPFYGSDDPAMFAIERRAMDPDGLVIAALDRLLPTTLVLDVGAGNGFTAARLSGPRRVVALEPDAGMIRGSLPWVRGEAERLPFRTAAVDGAYATWAYFFSRSWDPRPGIAELDRVVRPGGVLAIADNLGGDDFTALTEGDITADPAFWAAEGFACEEVASSFRFADLAEARRLLGFFFGDRGRAAATLELSFRVGLFHRSAASVRH